MNGPNVSHVPVTFAALSCGERFRLWPGDESWYMKIKPMPGKTTTIIYNCVDQSGNATHIVGTVLVYPEYMKEVQDSTATHQAGKAGA